MARDFAKSSGAKKKTPARKSAAKKKPARKTGAVKKKTDTPQGPSNGLVFTAGFASGFFVAFLVYLSGVAPDINNTAEEKPASVEQASKKPATENKTPKKIDFEFYQMLQEQEVEVEPTITPEIVEQQAENYHYFLQVASFRSLPDADRLKASLILEQGMTVNIRTVNGSNGTWHKVIAGPFETRSKLAGARSVLAQKGFNAMEFKRAIPE